MKSVDGDGGVGQKEKMKKINKRKRNERRLGGKGLSLETFANAKSGPSGFNPAVIKKQREFYRNAKYLSKFKKSMKRERQSDVPVTSRVEETDGCNKARDSGSKAKPTENKKRKGSSLQRVREEFEKQLEEKEKARMEREVILQAKREQRARVEAKRKSLKEKMFKKTRSGQPVMKYRIEHLLEGLAQNP